MQGQAAEFILELPYTVVTAVLVVPQGNMGTNCAAIYQPEIMTLSRYIY